MSHSTPVVVRNLTLVTLATLDYAPWPITFSRAPVQGYTLANIPIRADVFVITMTWGFLPNSALWELLSLPVNAETQWFLPVPGQLGTNMTWAWWQGVFEKPNDLTTFTRADWDAVTCRLVGAVSI